MKGMPMFLKPVAIFTDIIQIRPEFLANLGIKGIIFDLDNTIVPPHTNQLQNRVAKWLEAIQRAGVPYAVVSNNHDAHYLQQAERLLNVPVLGPARKPSRKMILQAVDWLKLSAHEVVVIGDRPLTDLWAGQRAGCPTILVDPLMRANEHGFTHLLRTLERLPVCVPEGTDERIHRL
jgi:uncharacterized protein